MTSRTSFARDLSREFFRLARLVESAQARQERIRRAAKLTDPGRYERFTVYDVRETTVRSYTRRGYRAVRFLAKKRRRA